MKKNIRRKSNETLRDWVDRVAKEFGLTDEQLEVAHEISIESYIAGINVEHRLKHMNA